MTAAPRRIRPRAARLAAALLLVAALPATARPLPVEESREESFELAFAAGAGARRLVVDNLAGPVTVVAADVDAVEVRLRRTDAAEDRDALERARREVRLVRAGGGETVRLVVEAPGRRADCRCFRGWDRLGYRVTHELELRVPRTIDLDVATVEAGDVEVRGVEGEIRAANVNGEVGLVRVAGRGEARTVNGSVEVTFAAPPAGAWSFATVNGRLDVALPPATGAELRFQTLNGEILSAFPYTPLPRGAGSAERDGDRYVYRADPWVRVRIGGGGPELSFDTVNGDILVRDVRDREG